MSSFAVARFRGSFMTPRCSISMPGSVASRQPLTQNFADLVAFAIAFDSHSTVVDVFMCHLRVEKARFIRALVPFDVDPSLRVGCPAACGGGGHFPARLEPCLGELLSASTCIPPHAAQRLCCNVLLSPNAKVVPARENPDPLQPSRRAMVLVSV